MLWRVQVVLKHRSGFTRDNVTNTFHMFSADVAGPTAAAVATNQRVFYETTLGNNALPLSAFIGSQIADAGHEIRVTKINMTTGEPVAGQGAPPDHIEALTLTNRGAEGPGLPSEVALCLSMKNLTMVSVPARRRRGRIYFGPIEAAHLLTDAGTGRVSPTAQLQSHLLEAGRAWRIDSLTAGLTWSIYSRPFEGRGEVVRPGRSTLPAIPQRNGFSYAVDAIFVDDAFDTQRRRGERPIVRSSVNF